MINALAHLTRYNPINPKITIEALGNKHTECKGILESLDEKQAIDKDSVNKRQYAFQKMGPLTTQIINAATVISEDKKLMEDMKGIVDKIRGTLPKPKTNDYQEGQEVTEARSNSQRSYDNLAAHFGKIIDILEVISGYTPNETEITIPELQTYHALLLEHNDTTSQTLKAVQNARRERDHAFYNEDEGLYMRTQLVKKYVKSVYTASSPESQQISGIEFRDHDND